MTTNNNAYILSQKICGMNPPGWIAIVKSYKTANSHTWPCFHFPVEIEREKREPDSQDRQDYGPPSYSPPSYKPEPYKPEPYKPEPYKPEPYKSYKPHLPAQIKSFVKTDYHANFKWGVKHNIQGPEAGYHW